MPSVSNIDQLPSNIFSQQSQMPGLPNFQQQFQRPGGSEFSQWQQPSVPTQTQPVALQPDQAGGQALDFNRFNTFMTTMENFITTYNNDRSSFSERLDRCLNLVPRVDSIDGRVHKLEMAYGANKSSDIKISGIPLTITDDPYVVATKVFTAMGFKNSENCIFHARELKIRNAAPQSAISTLHFDSAQTSQSSYSVPPQPPLQSLASTSTIVNPTFPANSKRVLIITLTSVSAREAVINRKREIKDLLSTNVFPGIPTFKIFVNEIYDSFTYQLLRKTRIRAQECGYFTPWVYNGKIMVRRDTNSPAIIISSEQDLLLLNRVNT